MQIRILKPGLHTTIQDLGRTQYLSQAVPISGALDPLSARIANLALGNPETTAVLEFSYANASFSCLTDILIAYAGGGAVLMASGEKLPSRRAIFLPAGTVVSLVHNDNGVRTYLSIAGGWDVPQVLGSRSTYLPAAFGGYEGRLLKKDDLLSSSNTCTSATLRMLHELRGESVRSTSWGISDRFLKPGEKNTLRVFPGREINWFEANSIVSLFAEPFRMDLRSNRMGMALKGPQMKRKVREELLSTAVCPGTIQVTGNGEMILLMADCQTTGGYPRIAHVAMADLPLCAQLKPHDQICFHLIDLKEAEDLYTEQEEELKRLVRAIHTKI
ncbi:biotin-dependent carboxyltransferase family protein [Pedobacter sp. AW31-3R]|uniref:5-oxoprolinase subunit C family protein n=1 Tax=Pedobacter sp. AW31-3R TaxID=3445781 RepID=UPI003F9EFE5F